MLYDRCRYCTCGVYRASNFKNPTKFTICEFGLNKRNKVVNLLTISIFYDIFFVVFGGSKWY